MADQGLHRSRGKKNKASRTHRREKRSSMEDVVNNFTWFKFFSCAGFDNESSAILADHFEENGLSVDDIEAIDHELLKSMDVTKAKDRIVILNATKAYLQVAAGGQEKSGSESARERREHHSGRSSDRHRKKKDGLVADKKSRKHKSGRRKHRDRDGDSQREAESDQHSGNGVKPSHTINPSPTEPLPPPPQINTGVEESIPHLRQTQVTRDKPKYIAVQSIEQREGNASTPMPRPPTGRPTTLVVSDGVEDSTAQQRSPSVTSYSDSLGSPGNVGLEPPEWSEAQDDYSFGDIEKTPGIEEEFEKEARAMEEWILRMHKDLHGPMRDARHVQERFKESKGALVELQDVASRVQQAGRLDPKKRFQKIKHDWVELIGLYKKKISAVKREPPRTTTPNGNKQESPREATPSAAPIKQKPALPPTPKRPQLPSFPNRKTLPVVPPKKVPKKPPARTTINKPIDAKSLIKNKPAIPHPPFQPKSKAMPSTQPDVELPSKPKKGRPPTLPPFQPKVRMLPPKTPPKHPPPRTPPTVMETPDNRGRPQNKMLKTWSPTKSHGGTSSATTRSLSPTRDEENDTKAGTKAAPIPTTQLIPPSRTHRKAKSEDITSTGSTKTLHIKSKSSSDLGSVPSKARKNYFKKGDSVKGFAMSGTKLMKTLSTRTMKPNYRKSADRPPPRPSNGQLAGFLRMPRKQPEICSHKNAGEVIKYFVILSIEQKKLSYWLREKEAMTSPPIKTFKMLEGAVTSCWHRRKHAFRAYSKSMGDTILYLIAKSDEEKSIWMKAFNDTIETILPVDQTPFKPAANPTELDTQLCKEGFADEADIDALIPILDRGANPNMFYTGKTQDETNGERVIVRAALKEGVSCIDLLVNYGAFVDVKLKDGTPLLLKVASKMVNEGELSTETERTTFNWFQMFSYILEHGATVQGEMPSGATLLHFIPEALFKLGDMSRPREFLFKLAVDLLQQGMDVNAQAKLPQHFYKGNKEVWTPFKLACKFGDMELVKLFAEQDPSFDGALVIASTFGHTELIPFLFENRGRGGADLSSPPKIMGCAKSVDVLKLLFETFPVLKDSVNDASRKKGWTALHYAVFNAHDSNTIKYLIDHGADPERENNAGETPYMLAMDIKPDDIPKAQVLRWDNIEEYLG